MTDVISHRGPDGDGHWLNDEGNVGLAHRRLAIIDLSENGRQPLHYRNRYTITFNGEIYNYLELKESLKKSGCSFTTESDTEVLIALFAEKGPAMLELVDGMYAFAIYDRVERKLFCARDRFGEKPFYYAYKPGDYFIFGSEIKQLLGFDDLQEANYNLVYNYLENPYMLGNPVDEHETFYKTIQKLPKATSITIDQNIIKTEKLYWSLQNIAASQISYEQAVEVFRDLFFTSVRRRLRSDVPIGSSLSGGLDSSSIVCSISKALHHPLAKQSVFSARFKNFDRDEGKYIGYVTSDLSITSVETWPNEKGFAEDLQRLIYFQDEPFPSASIYAQYQVMKAAKEHGVVVLLDGQGADETLAGYEYYLTNFLDELKFNSDPSLNEEYDLIRRLHPGLSLSSFDVTLNGPKRLNLAKRLKNKIVRSLDCISAKQQSAISFADLKYTKEFLAAASNGMRYRHVSDAKSLNQHLLFSVQKDNLEDLLRFCDRNSMAHSREVRLPFLNKDLVEFLFSLPAQYKIRKGWTKAILRDAMHGIIPPQIERRTDKIGYEPPQNKWMQSKQLQDIVSDAYHHLYDEGIISRSSLNDRLMDWQAINVSFMLKNRRTVNI